METKACAICGREQPLDKEHYRYRIQGGKGYFTAECRDCIKKAKEQSRERKNAKRQQAMEDIEKAGVDVFLATVSKGGSNIPHTAEVVERVMSYFGGVAGFSSVMVKQYWDSDPGGSQRNKLLETLCRLISKNVESGGAKKPLQLWSEEELEDELNKRLTEAVAGFNGVTIDASPEETPPSLPAPNPSPARPDAVPAGLNQGIAGGTAGQANRSVAAVPAKPESGSGTQQPGE